MSLAATSWALYEAPVDDATDVLILLGVAECGNDGQAYLVDLTAIRSIAKVARTTPEDVSVRLDRMVDDGVLHRIDLTGVMIRPNLDRRRSA